MEASKADLDLAAIREHTEKATEEIDALCSGSRRWTMQIPANLNTDSDIVIDRALSYIPALLDYVDTLAAQLDAVREQHPLNTDHRELQWCHHCETPWPCPTIQAIEGDQ